MDETSLTFLARLQAGAPDAWNIMNDDYGSFIERWLAGKGIPRQDAEEVRQLTLHKIWEELPRFRHNGRKGAFRKWLREIARNRMRWFLRQQKNQPSPVGSRMAELADELEDPQSSLSRAWDDEHNRQLAATLLRLVEPRFEASTLDAFRRTFFDDMSSEAAGAALGMSAGAVRVARSRVLAALRQAGEGLLN